MLGVDAYSSRRAVNVADEAMTSCSNCSFLFVPPVRSFALHLFQLERHLGDIDMSHVNPSANIC